MEDIENLVVAIICTFILGNAFHSTLAHYLPDNWKWREWLKRLFQRE